MVDIFHIIYYAHLLLPVCVCSFPAVYLKNSLCVSNSNLTSVEPIILYVCVYVYVHIHIYSHVSKSA